MHVLLPPSEAKNPGGRGSRFADRLAADDGPLADGRRAVTAALLDLVHGDADRAAEALLLPAGVAPQALATNAAVGTSRTTPALRRYAGVVYDGLDVAAMDPPMAREAGRRVLVFSGLLGVVRGDDPVPDYRVPAKATLPGIGVAGTFWRPRLEEVVPGLTGGGLVVDLRSGDYAAMWRPRGADAERVLTVRVLSPAPRGGLAVISHTSKLMKGRLAAALLHRAAAGQVPSAAEHVAQAWEQIGGLDCVPTTRGGRPGVDLHTRTSTG